AGASTTTTTSRTTSPAAPTRSARASPCSTTWLRGRTGTPGWATASASRPPPSPSPTAPAGAPSRRRAGASPSPPCPQERICATCSASDPTARSPSGASTRHARRSTTWSASTDPSTTGRSTTGSSSACAWCYAHDLLPLAASDPAFEVAPPRPRRPASSWAERPPRRLLDVARRPPSDLPVRHPREQGGRDGRDGRDGHGASVPLHPVPGAGGQPRDGSPRAPGRSDRAHGPRPFHRPDHLRRSRDDRGHLLGGADPGGGVRRSLRDRRTTAGLRLHGPLGLSLSGLGPQLAAQHPRGVHHHGQREAHLGPAPRLEAA